MSGFFRIIIFLFACLIFCCEAKAGETLCEARYVTIHGDSLSPLVRSGDRILMKPASCVKHIKRGMPVVFKTGAHKRPVIKIVRGIPGDNFALEEGNIFVNGGKLKNSAGQDYSLDSSRASLLFLYERDYGGLIPGHTYLLLGDKVRGALDSSRIGFVHENDIIMAGEVNN